MGESFLATHNQDLCKTEVIQWHNDEIHDDNYTDITLSDHDLLSEISYGFNDTIKDNPESHGNNCTKHEESSEMLKKFPEQLRMILEQPRHLSAISWKDDGNSFIIHDQAVFLNEIIPLYFKTSRWKSFQKQLNIYGFQRVEGQRREYYHQFFTRNEPILMRFMKREKVWPTSKTISRA